MAEEQNTNRLAGLYQLMILLSKKITIKNREKSELKRRTERIELTADCC